MAYPFRPSQDQAVCRDENGAQSEKSEEAGPLDQPESPCLAFSENYLNCVQEVLTSNTEDSASHIEFWSNQPINPATYFQMEVARRAESQRQKDLELQRQNHIRAQERRARVIAEFNNRIHQSQLRQWIQEEQDLTYEQRYGYAFVAEEDVEKMRVDAQAAWNSEESDRIYDLTMDRSMQYFLDCEFFGENHDTHWSEKGLVTYLPEHCFFYFYEGYFETHFED